MSNLFWLLCLLGPAVYGFVQFGWLNAALTLVGGLIGAFVVNMALASGARLTGRFISGVTLWWSAVLSMLVIGLGLSHVIG